MALAKHYEEIIERRARNAARVVFEYQYPHSSKSSAADPFAEYTPEKLEEIRAFARRITQECEERLARENILVFELNKERTESSPVGYMTKAEAADRVPTIPAGELLDLDDMYTGIFVRSDHLFISEAKLLDGLRRYGPDVTLQTIINEDAKERKRRLAA